MPQVLVYRIRLPDYLYLIQFARANMLAGYKTKNFEDIVRSAEIVLHINREMSLHLEYCAEFGLSKEDILKVEESQACTAYTRFVLDTGSSDDWLALQVALAPCLIGYGVIAKRLFADPKTLREGNRYWKWIENYAAADYSEAVELGIGRVPGKHRHRNLNADFEQHCYTNTHRKFLHHDLRSWSRYLSTLQGWRPDFGIWGMEGSEVHIG